MFSFPLTPQTNILEKDLLNIVGSFILGFYTLTRCISITVCDWFWCYVVSFEYDNKSGNCLKQHQGGICILLIFDKILLHQIFWIRAIVWVALYLICFFPSNWIVRLGFGYLKWNILNTCERNRSWFTLNIVCLTSLKCKICKQWNDIISKPARSIVRIRAGFFRAQLVRA